MSSVMTFSVHYHLGLIAGKYIILPGTISVLPHHAILFLSTFVSIAPASCFDSQTTSKHWWETFPKVLPQSSPSVIQLPPTSYSKLLTPVSAALPLTSLPHFRVSTLYWSRKLLLSKIQCKSRQHKIKTAFSWTRLSGFKFWLCFWLAVQPWTSYVSSLCLNFFIDKTEIMRVPISFL